MTAPTTESPVHASVLDAISTAPLTAADRCDRCGAQAYLRATFIASLLSLLFCNHHGTKYQFTLIEQGATLFGKPVDRRVNDTDH